MKIVMAGLAQQRIIMLSTVWTVVATLALSGVPALAEDVVSISTTIKGNQEHPGVTYIVPWRQAANEDSVHGNFNNSTRLNEVFDHVEKIEHDREVDYLVQMQGKFTGAFQESAP
jgi:hypothetical protein